MNTIFSPQWWLLVLGIIAAIKIGLFLGEDYNEEYATIKRNQRKKMIQNIKKKLQKKRECNLDIGQKEAKKKPDIHEYNIKLMKQYERIKNNGLKYDDILLENIKKLMQELNNLEAYTIKYPYLNINKTYLKFMDYYLPELLNSIDTVIEVNSLENQQDAVALRSEVANMTSDIQTSIQNFILENVLSEKIINARSSAVASILMMQQDGLLGNEFNII